MKSMDLFARQECPARANRSDTRWYRKDLQHSMADKDTISCQGLVERSEGQP